MLIRVAWPSKFRNFIVTLRISQELTSTGAHALHCVLSNMRTSGNAFDSLMPKARSQCRLGSESINLALMLNIIF